MKGQDASSDRIPGWYLVEYWRTQLMGRDEIGEVYEIEPLKWDGFKWRDNYLRIISEEDIVKIKHEIFTSSL